jgi:hypothetical protein
VDGGEEGARGNRAEYEEFRKALEHGLKPVLHLGTGKMIDSIGFIDSGGAGV